MSGESSTAVPLFETSMNLPEMSSVRLRRSTWEHISDRHLEIHECVGVEGILETVKNPTQVLESKTKDEKRTFVFVSNNVNYGNENIPLNVPEKSVSITFGSVQTAYSKERASNSPVVWTPRNDN